MLSSVLNSRLAIRVNIQIMRAFVALKRISLTYAGLKRMIQEIEKKYDSKFRIVFEAIERIILEMEKVEKQGETSKRRIGFY